MQSEKSSKSQFRLSPSINPKRVFILQKRELEKRWDPNTYHQERRDIIQALKKSGHKLEQLKFVSSFKKSVFKTHQFSEYFDGYGLYEDADFTSRLSKTGNLYVNTNAKLGHYHNDSGRPNKYNYGKMVIRNGWYVWRVKNPNPRFKDCLKWHTITIILSLIRFSNTFTSSQKKRKHQAAVMGHE